MTNEQREQFIGFAGFDYRLPLMIVATIEIDSQGDGRFGARKSIDLVDRLALFSEFYYDTASKWDWRVGLDYTLSKHWSITTLYDNQHGWGAGFTFQF